MFHSAFIIHHSKNPSVLENHDDELLDDYLLGRLDEPARLRVEQRALHDAEFASELNLRRDIVRGIELSGEAGLREKIAALDGALAAQGFFEEKRPALGFVRGGLFSRKNFRWAAAASVAVLLAAATWVFWQNKSTDSEKMAVQPPSTTIGPDTARRPSSTVHRPPSTGHRPRRDANRYLAIAREAYAPPDYSSLRTVGATTPTLLSAASAAYEKGEFRQVAQLLDTVSAASAFYWQAVEIRAHAHYRSGQTGQAAQQFRQLANSGRLPFSERAEWFLLICLAENYPRSKHEFEALHHKILTDTGHPFYEETKVLAEKLRAEK